MYFNNDVNKLCCLITGLIVYSCVITLDCFFFTEKWNHERSLLKNTKIAISLFTYIDVIKDMNKYKLRQQNTRRQTRTHTPNKYTQYLCKIYSGVYCYRSPSSCKFVNHELIDIYIDAHRWDYMDYSLLREISFDNLSCVRLFIYCFVFNS